MLGPRGLRAVGLSTDADPWTGKVSHCPARVAQVACTRTSDSSSRRSGLVSIDRVTWAQDVVRLLCELMVFCDLTYCRVEATAMLVEAVIVFGRDAQALFGLLLCLRAMYGVGRSAVVEETAWVHHMALAALARALE